MDGYESNRRGFLGKLGLTLGAATLTATGFSATINETKTEFQLTHEQSQFMEKYEKWLDAFHDMAQVQKLDPNNYQNNVRLVELSEEAKTWQKELITYMKDENFARHYMITTERVTNQI